MAISLNLKRRRNSREKISKKKCAKQHCKNPNNPHNNHHNRNRNPRNPNKCPHHPNRNSHHQHHPNNYNHNLLLNNYLNTLFLSPGCTLAFSLKQELKDRKAIAGPDRHRPWTQINEQHWKQWPSVQLELSKQSPIPISKGSWSLCWIVKDWWTKCKRS